MISLTARNNFWIKTHFAYDKSKIWRLPGKVFKQRREVLTEDVIWDTIIRVHNSLDHAGQHATAGKINNEYCEIASAEVYFLVKLFEICHRKAHSKSTGPLKPIVITRLFERVRLILLIQRPPRMAIMSESVI